MKTKLQLLMIFILSNMAIANAQNTWTMKSYFGGISRYTAVGFSIGSKGYIGTGSPDGGSPTIDFWEWDPSTNVWTQKANYGGSARFDGVGFSIGTKGYIGTGTTNAGDQLQDLWEWDQTANVWSQKTSLPGPGRRLGVGFSIGGFGYIAMGTSAGLNIFYNDLWQYEPAADTVGGTPWIQKASYPGAGRASAFCFVVGAKGYVGTGTDWNVTYSDFRSYDPATDVWTTLGNFSGGQRYGANGFSINNKGYVGTGLPGFTQDFREYDPGTDVWTQRANFGGSGRCYPVSFSIGNRGYVGTGFNGTGINDLWEYFPIGVGMDEVKGSFNVSVYPNPSKGAFSIDSEIKCGEITIYNTVGEIIYSSKLNPTITEIDLSSQAKGIYFVKVQDGEKGSTKKIVIE